MRKFSTLIALAVVFSILLAGCGPSATPTVQPPAPTAKPAVSPTDTPVPAATGPKKGGKLVMSFGEADMDTLDPVVTFENSAVWTVLLMYDQLFRVTEDGQAIEPDAVDQYDISADGLTYTFHLRDGLTFSDGTAVTADDAAFSMERMLQSDNWGWLFAPGITVQATGNSEFQMVLPTVSASFLNNLAGFWSSIVPKKLVEQQGDAFWEKPVGSGPFELVQWSKGESVLLQRNPYYWEEGKPYLDEIEIQVITDDETRMLKFKAGELDIALNVPPTQVQDIDQLADAEVRLDTIFNIKDIRVNGSHKPLDDINVRQALEYATDKQSIIDAVLFGYGEIATTHWPKVLYMANRPEPYPYSIEAAKQALAKSSVPNGFDITLTYTAGSTTDAQIATILQQQWAQIGVNVKLEALEPGILRERRYSAQLDLVVHYMTSDVIDPTELAPTCSITERETTLCNQDFETLFNQAETMLDPAQRAAAYDQLVKISDDWAMCIPLYHYPARSAVWGYVKDFQVLPTANFWLWNVWLDK
jgi:peptide/nickel transport system substrate-binding protein